MSILKKNSKGKAVIQLQKDINALQNRYLLNTDGNFGDRTDIALRYLQQFLKLEPDGKAGPQTQAAIRQALKPASNNAKQEPDKSAMGQVVPIKAPVSAVAAPPPNVASLKLLDTVRFIDEIIFHCAATPEGKDYTVDDIRAWHKARDFIDVGYHFIIYRDGRIMLGRPIGQIGSHVAGHNTGTIGVVYIGGVSADGKTAKDTRTAAQRSSLLWLKQQLAAKFKIKKFKGHNQYANKACPSFNVPTDELGKAI